jgi:hypothetical protein
VCVNTIFIYTTTGFAERRKSTTYQKTVLLDKVIASWFTTHGSSQVSGQRSRTNYVTTEGGLTGLLTEVYAWTVDQIDEDTDIGCYPPSPGLMAQIMLAKEMVSGLEGPARVTKLREIRNERRKLCRRLHVAGISGINPPSTSKMSKKDSDQCMTEVCVCVCLCVPVCVCVCVR